MASDGSDGLDDARGPGLVVDEVKAHLDLFLVVRVTPDEAQSAYSYAFFATLSVREVLREGS